MSGFAGLILIDGADVTPPVLDRLAVSYPHAAPDGVDLWRAGPAGFVRFALQNTPEARGEVQPFIHEESGAVLLFDGRLDNRDDLLGRLAGDAPSRRAPDGQIVLAAFERIGDQAIHLLVGDYALALWRPRERRLYCARSPVGWRPFLWTFDGRRFAFANEFRTLVEGLPLERRLNEGAIAEHLGGMFTSLTDTFWDGIYRLPPGEALVVENGRVRTWRWNQGPFEDLSDLSEADHVDRFRTLFDDALIATHRSEGPVASQLSGGLDSSSVVCRSVDLHRAGRVAGQVQPISARFPGQTCDEGPWIEAVERKIGFSGAGVAPTLFDVAEAESWCARTLHLPLRPNALATLAPVCDLLVSRGVKVLLTGEGGDDWFNGSRSHWPDLFLSGQWGRLLKEGMDQGGGTVPGKLLAILRAGVGPVVSATSRDHLFRPHTLFPLDSPDWIRPELSQRVNLSDRWRQAPGPPDLDSYAQRQRYLVYAISTRHTVSDMVSSYVDGRGIEMRHPFHDLRLTRFAMGAAGGVLRKGRLRKHLLRESMRGVLPEEVRTRLSKSNFSASLINAVSDRFLQKRPQDLLPVQMGLIDVAPLLKIHQDYLVWMQAGAVPPFPAQPYGPVWNAVSMDILLEHAFRL